MEPMMESVGNALKIIADVTATADHVCVNKNQCKRLAARFSDIRKALEVPKTEHIGDGTPALDQILTVLKKGQALVHDYADESKVLDNVLYRVDNIEAFKEVHDDISGLATFLDLGEMEETSLLDSDAATDRREIANKAHDLIVNDIPNDSGSVVGGNVEGDVANMQKVVVEKCYDPDLTLEERSYLKIPFSAIRLHCPIKELKPLLQRKSQADAHLDGLALVHKGEWNGCACAIKQFKSKDVQWNTQELHKEIASLVKLRHPHVTQLLGCSEHENETYVLYEMMDSDLRKLIDTRMEKKPKSRPFNRAQEASIITQIARGMFYLHEKGFVHGELKCTNLLVKERGDHIDVKVADFHCSRELGKKPTSKYKPAHRPRWMPPEAFQHYNIEQPSDEILMKGDVYSFGMTSYEVVTGKYPFDGIRGKALEEMIKAGERPNLPKELSEDLKNLIAKCWHPDPEQRPRFQEICYVLKVQAPNLSQFQKLIEGLSLLNCISGGRVVPDPKSQDWSEVLKVGRITKAIQDDDIGAVKDLPHHLRIKPSALEPLQRLGKGASAEVFAASWIGCRFAVKWLKIDQVVKLRNEVSILEKLLHPHVIRLVGFSVLEKRCAIVMELLDMSLQDLIVSRIKASKDPKHATPFSEAEALAIMRKLALGMGFLHSREVTHGDLKPANVLVGHENLKAGMDVKIVDFGLSRLLGESTSEKVSVLGRYRAPEVILSMETKEPVGDPKAADVYSFALVCFEVITGKKPYFQCNDNAVADVAKGGSMPKLGVHDRVRQDLWQLLEKCWSMEPEGRPKFDDVVKELDRMCTAKGTTYTTAM